MSVSEGGGLFTPYDSVDFLVIDDPTELSAHRERVNPQNQVSDMRRLFRVPSRGSQGVPPSVKGAPPVWDNQVS
jgi:hypothetical protein